ncbi:MAG: PHB depolymerase family esterase [Candidatus Binatia bacterium]|nr:PHB depolymerase family esterase [Candidatus Binatia bacterium]
MDLVKVPVLRFPLGNLVLLSAVALSSCSDGDGSNSNHEDPARLLGSCPENFTAQEGGNGGFLSDGDSREFHVFLPETLDTARPLFVSLTGTVATELEFVANERSQLESLVDSGWIVVAPFRTCTTENRTCRGIGPQGTNDGRFWEPWFDGAITQTNDEGPDVRFIESMVKCVAASYRVDENRIYGGGISAGGTMTHRNMMFNSDLFAGGVAASGNYRYLSQLHIEPVDPIIMDSSIVVVLWGGPEDTFGGTSFYDVETKLASEYYAAQSDVVTVSCSGTHGHVWPPAFTAWAAQTVLSHPKGTPVEDFVLTTPPDGFSCVVGVYTDH